MSEFDDDRTLVEDRLMKAVRRAKLALTKAQRLAKKLGAVKTDADGFTYAGGKMQSFEDAAKLHAEGSAVLLQAIEGALERKLEPPKGADDD